MSAQGKPPVLSVHELDVLLLQGGRLAPVVEQVSFDLYAGEVLGLVGESGCGKSKTAEAVMGLLPPESGTVRCAGIQLDGRALDGLPEAALRRIRGAEISMVFQEPLTALDPVLSCGSQLCSVYRRHRGLGRRQAREEAAHMLERVGFADTGRILRSHPHQLSGGQRQRVLIAMAMACAPRVLIADEPTTALDVTTQARVLEQLTRLGREAGTGILLITHDLGIVAQYCDRALVMRAGRIVEEAVTSQLFTAPATAYARRLLDTAAELRP